MLQMCQVSHKNNKAYERIKIKKKPKQKIKCFNPLATLSFIKLSFQASLEDRITIRFCNAKSEYEAILVQANQRFFVQVAWNVITKASEIALTTIELSMSEETNSYRESPKSNNGRMLFISVAFDAAE